MIMFLVLNTAGLVLVPMTVMMYRARFGAENPADVFLPIGSGNALCLAFGAYAGFGHPENQLVQPRSNGCTDFTRGFNRIGLLLQPALTGADYSLFEFCGRLYHTFHHRGICHHGSPKK